MTDKNVVQFTGGKVPAALQQLSGDNTDLSSGVRGGYSVISIRGSRFHVKANGEEQTLIDPNTGDPVGSLRLVLLKANPNVSKNFYKSGYVEGSSEGPDCFSIDGITPDPGAPHPQASKCAACPQNVFGSRITEQGKKAKACADSRRLAVIPEGNFKNEVYGGPMLLRVPAASLSGLAQFGKKMQQRGFPYNTILTRVSFDHDVAHPKLEFNALRPLTDEEANELVALLNDHEFAEKIETVLAKDLEVVAPPAGDAPEAPLFEEAPDVKAKAAPQTAPVAPQAAPVAQQAPKPQPVPTAPPVNADLGAAPVQEEVPEPAVVSDESDDQLDDELKQILASLDSM